MSQDPTDDDLPPEYRDDAPETEHPGPSTLPAPPEDDYERRHRAFIERMLAEAHEVTRAQEALKPAIAEAGRRLAEMRHASERKDALAKLDLAIDTLKAIPFPQPYDPMIDAFAEVMRKAIHELYPES